MKDQYNDSIEGPLQFLSTILLLPNRGRLIEDVDHRMLGVEHIVRTFRQFRWSVWITVFLLFLSLLLRLGRWWSWRRWTQVGVRWWRCAESSNRERSVDPALLLDWLTPPWRVVGPAIHWVHGLGASHYRMCWGVLIPAVCAPIPCRLAGHERTSRYGLLQRFERADDCCDEQSQKVPTIDEQACMVDEYKSFSRHVPLRK